MPNATVRANARPMPKPKPGSVASIRRQTADLKSATALLKASQATVCETASQDDAEAFSRAYGRWLKARGAIKGGAEFPEDERAVRALFDADRTALRELFSAPAAYAEDVWLKLGVFETELIDERVTGEPRDSVLLLALGSIKADLVNLGIDDERRS
jgi:hypothetical protein